MVTTLPKRRKPKRSGIRRVPPRAIEAHKQWVRGHECILAYTGECRGKVRFCHVRNGIPYEHAGGMGLKSRDLYGYPGCDGHHEEQGRLSEPGFERKYGINLRKIAEQLARRSPHKHRWLKDDD